MLLTWITFLPLLGLVAILLVPGRYTRLIQGISVATTFLLFWLSVILVQNYQPNIPGYQFVERVSWIDLGLMAERYEEQDLPNLLSAVERTRNQIESAYADGRTDDAAALERSLARQEEQLNKAQRAVDRAGLARTVTGEDIRLTSDIEYYMGVDGLSVALVFLTGLLSFLATFYTFTIKKNVKGFQALYMILITGMMGVFVSLDLFLFYVFWEVMLLPMYFLIGIWGGPRREYAAIKFFIYTLVGSVLMLVAILALYMRYGTFSIPDLIAIQPFLDNIFIATLCFWGFFIAFAVKIPMFPFHTWLPDAHVEAPTAISVILAGVLLKLGGYGIFRICLPMFSVVTIDSLTIMALFGFINIVYGAMCAMAQTDFKKLVAYSSVSHMGFILLGIAAMNGEGMNGSFFQMFSHGLNSAMMFMCVGVIYERAHHRDLNRFGGIANVMPVYFALSTIAFFASLGLPGMSGFVSEVLVFLGAFKEYPWIAGMGVIGVVLTAAFILWMIQRVYLGETPDEYKDFEDVNKFEFIGLAPLAFLTILLGVMPNLLIDLFDENMASMIEQIRWVSSNYAQFLKEAASMPTPLG
jgi:NADH-quinone oxidoreductase subunit M